MISRKPTFVLDPSLQSMSEDDLSIKASDGHSTDADTDEKRRITNSRLSDGSSLNKRSRRVSFLRFVESSIVEFN